MEWISELLTFITSQTGKAVGALGTLAVSLVGAGYWVGNRLGRNKRLVAQKQIKALNDQLDNSTTGLRQEQRHSAAVTEELDTKRKELAHTKQELVETAGQLAMAKKKLIPYYQAYVELKPKYAKLVKDLDDELQRVARLTSDRGEAEKAIIELRTNLLEREKQLDQIERRTQRALKLHGNLWAAKALQARPKFRPLPDRGCPIISVLNLKGGVGKTTVTAQLGLALVRKGYRVLLVDLDFQGSLTQMLLPHDVQRGLAVGKQLVHHFLDLASADKTTKLIDYIQTPQLDLGPAGGKLGLVAASDNLAYTELNLTLRWLLRRGDRDNRFLLRKALHMRSVTRAYDVILLDCPPLMNVSCINALAASDYLLVPVTLSRPVMERVPVLLKRFLREPRFIHNVNAHLCVLGLIANRTHRDEFSAAEREDWALLAKWCKDGYGQEVRQFKTVIQQLNREVRDNETVLTESRPESKLSQLFAALAAEVEQELPNECRRGATTLS